MGLTRRHDLAAGHRPGAAALGGPGRQFPFVCAGTARGVVAAGSETIGPTPRAVLWTSPDGRTWTRSAAFAAAASAADGLSAVAADGDRIMVMGTENRRPSAYASLNGGTRWSRVGVDEGGFGLFGGRDSSAAAIRGDDVVVVGTDDNAGAVWVGRLPPRR